MFSFVRMNICKRRSILVAQGFHLEPLLSNILASMDSKPKTSQKTRMSSPTFSGKASTRKINSKSPGTRKARREPPEVYVLVQYSCKHSVYHRAHFRLKRGYLEICWRQGKQVRTHYIGRGIANSPTRQARKSGKNPFSHG